MSIEQVLDYAEAAAQDYFTKVEKTGLVNQGRVLDAFAAERVSDYHLHGSTGYGYGDSGRDVVERVYVQEVHVVMISERLRQTL